MTTNELEGRALAEAAARAMGWQLSDPDADVCMEWLRERWLEGYGDEIKAIVYRLVVAVAAREQAAKGEP